jgi:hypothetical protein
MNREQSLRKLREFYARRRFIDARNLCLDLTHMYPQDIEIWKARCDLHFQLDERKSFGECSQHIIRLLRAKSPNPEVIKTYRILSERCVSLGCIQDAINVYEHLIAANPNDADAHTCAAMCHLLLGDFRRGWPEYEWRLKTNYMTETPTGKPRWDGGSLENKVILIEAEQGHGDTVQFVRYLRDVKARGGTVILGCQPALRSLLAGCAGVDRIVSQGDLAPPYDVETTLLSLPGIFQTSLDTIPADVPYLRVPQSAGAQAVTTIARYTGVLRVGLVWAGGIHTKNRHRSLTLGQFRNLFGIEGTKFFSLQKGDAVADLKSFPQDIIVDLDHYLGEFADTAATIQALDLVISVDTAVAHLAGALGKPVWTLIPFAPDWRWMLNREDSPWYPTMRLFRQPAPGDWSSVITRLKAQLTALVQEQSTSAAAR